MTQAKVIYMTHVGRVQFRGGFISHALLSPFLFDPLPLGYILGDLHP